jgi:putative oxidoreductase
VSTLDTSMTARPQRAAARRIAGTLAHFARVPHSLIALPARVSVAVTFWLSGQTKIEGLVLDPLGGTVQLEWPRISENAIELFRSEYALPLLPPELATYLAAVAEHVFPLLLVIGLASRLSALALLAMTLVIQVFVYPAAFATHGLWAVSLLYVMARGPGVLSLDALIARRCGVSAR